MTIVRTLSRWKAAMIDLVVGWGLPFILLKYLFDAGNWAWFPFMIYIFLGSSRLWRGQSLGLYLVGMEVQRRGGGWLPYSRALLRGISMGAFIWVLGYSWKFLQWSVLSAVLPVVAAQSVLLVRHPRKQGLLDLIGWSVVEPRGSMGTPNQHLTSYQHRQIATELTITILLAGGMVLMLLRTL